MTHPWSMQVEYSAFVFTAAFHFGQLCTACQSCCPGIPIFADRRDMRIDLRRSDCTVRWLFVGGGFLWRPCSGMPLRREQRQEAQPVGELLRGQASHCRLLSRTGEAWLPARSSRCEAGAPSGQASARGPANVWVPGWDLVKL